MNTDPYQEAYELHQERKKKQLLAYKEDAFEYLAKSRHSCRIFKLETVDLNLLEKIDALTFSVPSSCNRKGVFVGRLDTPYNIPLGSLLVGGKNWIEHAPHTILLWADPVAYKSPAEKTFMPYLDCGFMGMHLLYHVHSMNLAACFCNPNIRPEDIEVFNKTYNPNGLIFGGAVAFGYAV